jgi:hypothetical protein
MGFIERGVVLEGRQAVCPVQREGRWAVRSAVVIYATEGAVPNTRVLSGNTTGKRCNYRR